MQTCRMDKKLFAAITAIFLTLIAQVSVAQSSVTVYGILDIGLAYQAIGGVDNLSETRFGMNNGVQSGSRFGLRGAEDLGGGNRATFTLENGFDAGNGTLLQGGRLFGRQAWVGLENDAWGYLRAGRQYNFATDYFLPIDPFRTGFGQAGMGVAFGSMNSTRFSNLLKYQSPVWSGLKLGIGYAFAPQLDAFYVSGGEVFNGQGNSYNFESTNNTRALSLGANYNNGPLTLAASYDQIMPNQNAPGVPAGGAGNTNIKAWILGGSYDFTVAQLSLAYGQTRGGVINGTNFTSGGSKSALDSSGGTWGGAAGGVLFADGLGFNSYILGMTAPLGGSSKLFGAWTLASLALSTGTQGSFANQNMYSLGYQYDFTKRTNWYAAVSYASNPGFVSGMHSTVVVTGMRHQF